MSNRNIRKVRHYKSAPTFKERSQAGVVKQTAQLWAKYGWGESNQPKYEPELEVVLPVEEHEHVHGPDCNHDH